MARETYILYAAYMDISHKMVASRMTCLSLLVRELDNVFNFAGYS